MLRRHRQRILLTAQQAVHMKLYLDDIAGNEVAERNAFDPRIGAVYVHPDPIPDQHANHRVFRWARKLRPNLNDHGLAPLKCPASHVIATQEFNFDYLADAIPMAERRLGSVAFKTCAI